jgi:hypothetical protein
MSPDPRRVATRFLAATLMMKQVSPSFEGSIKEFKALDADRKEVGRVYQRRVTKEVFRQGQDMTVPVLGWFYRVPGGPEVGMGRKGPEWVYMSDAVEALASAK